MRTLRTDIALSFALFAALAYVAVVVARMPGTAAVVWVANGMAMALIVSAPAARTLPMLAAAALGNLVGNLAYGHPWLLSLAFVPPNIAEVALGLWLVRRTGLASRFAETQRNFLWVLGAGALLPPLLGATLGAATLHGLGMATFARVWSDWYVGAALGALAMVPLGLTLRASGAAAALARLATPGGAGVLLALALATAVVLQGSPYPFVAIGVLLTVLAFVRSRLETFVAVAMVVVVVMALSVALGAPAVPASAEQHALFFAAAALAVLPAQVVAVAMARQRALSQTLAAVGSRTDDIVVFTDPTGVVRWANEAREIYWGVPNAQVIGRHGAEVLPAGYWQAVMAPLYRQAQQGQVVRRKVDIDFPGRGLRTMEVSLQPAYDEDSWRIGVLLCSTDVTELETSRRELERSAESLRASHERLAQFVRIASHDLREPLNAITQFCGLIEGRHAAQLPPDAALYLGHVQAAAARMRQMMDEVLQFVRLDEEAAPPRELVDLDALGHEVCAEFDARIQAQQAVVEQGPLGVVSGHRSLLAILLRNLMSNALKFVPAGSAPRVRVSAERDGAVLRLSVADNGIGIEPAHIGELGTPFRRLHARRKYEGTGLGLAICKRIAAQHGGALEVSSVFGEGSHFTLVLPLGDSAGVANGAVNGAASGAASGADTGRRKTAPESPR